MAKIIPDCPCGVRRAAGDFMIQIGSPVVLCAAGVAGSLARLRACRNCRLTYAVTIAENERIGFSNG
jgi:hypothetical protein